MAAPTHKFQPPKGTRDFYPAEMAVRRYIESVWREVSINHGFEEIDGPTFEHLEMYTTKSGPGIVSELFSFRREGGNVDYALRPEFTPTLARMYGSRAAQLPKPVKWFVIESNFRAERPQRGRLREFFQWNADIIGDDSPRADAEIIAVTVGVLERLGLTHKDVKVKISDRRLIEDYAKAAGIAPDKYDVLMWVADNLHKLPQEQLDERVTQAGISEDDVRAYFAFLARANEIAKADMSPLKKAEELGVGRSFFDRMNEIHELVYEADLDDWWDQDAGIVRGLAYYTGTVFEVIAQGERSVAGGGRYDGLVELFGGPSTPAVGIAMGDVVLRLLLEDRGLLKPAELMPRPDAFVISALDDDGEQMRRVVSDLRREGLHARHTYRSTKNVGKLLGEAGKVRARFAVILGEELQGGKVALKNLDTGDQSEIPLDQLADALR